MASPTGTKKLTVEEYMRWVHAIQPDAFVALSEEAPCFEGIAMKKTQVGYVHEANLGRLGIHIRRRRRP